jgi:lipopolysaccharide transport system permease protein
MNQSFVKNHTAIPTIRVQPSKGIFALNLKALWEYRELLYFLVWRDIKVRYKQTLIGAAWVIVQPLLTMVIFAVVFGNLAKLPSDGFPYPVFTYVALLPWTFFSQALTQSSASLIGEAHLIRKVYFPRLIIPLSAAMVPLIDFALSFVVLLGMLAWFGIKLHWGIVCLPLFLLLSFHTAVSIGLWFSALSTKYRDVRYVVPFLIQAWMYASPIVYPLSLVPERWRLLYGINPMVGVIEGFRWGLLGKELLDLRLLAVSAATVILLFGSGLVYFRHMERAFADII